MLHLQAKAFKIAVPVRETCAADDQIAFFRKIHQRFVLHTTIGFGHPQFQQRNGAVQHGLEVGGHAVTVERKAPEDDVCLNVGGKNVILIILLDTFSIPICPAAKAAKAGQNSFLNHIHHVDFTGDFSGDSAKKAAGQAHGVAFCLRAAIEHQNVHLHTPLVLTRNSPWRLQQA